MSKELATAPPANTNVAALPAKKVSLLARVAAKYEVDGDKMMDTLKATCFRQKGKNGGAAPEVSNEQMMALLIVAEQYNLNPFTKEIYAFPSEGGIVPIIGFDGWIRIINERTEFEAMELAYAPEGSDNPWIECTIWRKDRGKPITIREYLSECLRDTGPWQSHPRRMLRHKAIIQCARVAFGYGGIYDPDEAERVANAIDVTPRDPVQSKPATAAPRSKTRTEVHPEPAKETPKDQGPVYVTHAQVGTLTDKSDAEGIPLNALCAKYEIGDVRELLARDFDAAFKWLGEVNG